MKAQSFVVGARTLGTRADAVLEKPLLAGDETVLEKGQAQLADISTLTSLVTAGSPLPVPGSTTEAAETDLVTELLGYLYDNGVIRRESLDDPLVNRAQTSDRVTGVGRFFLVPLGTETQQKHNWRPVFRLLVDRLDRVASKSERIVSRLEGAQSASVSLRTWRTGLESVRDVQTAIRVQLIRQERLRRLYGRPADEPAKFARWTLDQLSNELSES